MRCRAALALVLIVLTVVPAACGGGDSAVGRSTELVWSKAPRVVVPPTLPRDRILRGEVKNEGLKKITVKAADVRLLDGDGRHIEGQATFIAGYAHSLFPYGRGPGSGPGRYPDYERERLGQFAVLKPGQSRSLTVSWHDPPGPSTPVSIDYGPGSLKVPAVNDAKSTR
jgi:hypothetical protein